MALAAALLASASVLSYRSAQRALDDARSSRRAQEVIGQAREVLALVTDAETAQRGFALTADERFLDPYHRALDELPHEMALLRSLTADNADLRRRLDELEALQKEKLRHIAETIEVRRSQGLDAVARRVGRLQGKQIMDEVRTALAQIEEEERRLQAERDRDSPTSTGASNLVMLGVSLTALALVGVAFLRVAHENAKRARAEESLCQLNAQLEERVRERTARVEAANEELRRDIAERSRLETALRESERRIRATLDSMLEGCQIIGFDWRYLYVNDVAARQGRRLRDELLGRTMMDAYPGIEHSDMFAALRRSMEQRVPHRMENAFAPSDGSTSWFELSMEPVPEGVFILSMEVTERRRAEAQRERALQELGESEERYRRLVENIREVIIAGELDGTLTARKLTFVSPQIEELTGRAPQDFVDELDLFERLLHPEDIANVAMETERALAKGEPVGRFYRLRNERTGEYRWFEDTFVPSRGDDGAMRGFFVTARDITERWRAENGRLQADLARQESERMLRLVLDTIPQVIFWKDRECRFLGANRRLAEIARVSDPSEVVGRTDDDLPWKEHAEQYRADDREVMESGRAKRGIEETVRGADGAVRLVRTDKVPLVDAEGRVIGILGAFEDVTERRRIEQMFQQSQKLEAIGRLAGGVAHDFNNILGVITGYAELMRRQIDTEHPARPRLEQILDAARRAAGLTRQLLTFSRKQDIQPRILDLNGVVGDLDKMLRRVIGEDVQLELRQGSGLGAVKADPTQLEQVVLNLVVNSRDAMPKGGHLTIETANADFDEAYAAAHPPAQAGSFVMLSVSDTGIGMDTETQRRIFEPFFTTKPQGEGTGLGLATVYGVVNQSGGYIRVYSEPGHGTTFKVYLPRVNEQPRVLDAETSEAAPLPHGQETVLLVEDSESLREVIRDMLEEQGYTLLLAFDGKDALALAREHSGPIHLLLTDLVMPKLGGADLARLLASLRPEIRVLYMSGYTDAAISQQGVLRDGAVLIEKPFTSGRLTRAVRAALDAAERA